MYIQNLNQVILSPGLAFFWGGGTGWCKPFMEEENQSLMKPGTFLFLILGLDALMGKCSVEITVTLT